MRWALGVGCSIMFLQFAWLYGRVLLDLSWHRALGGFALGAVLLDTAVNQYKAAEYGFPVDWITWLSAVTVVIGIAAQSITILERRAKRDEGTAP